MCALLVNAIKPTLMQSIEGQPMFVHAGPFANIAIGQNSVVADRLACALGDYVVTESGFASDMGYEKFWNIKCRASGLKPDAVVLVATVRALKAHGGAPAVKAGLPLDPVYTTENLELLEKGCDNLLAHIDIIRRSGIQPVVCLNAFYTDTDAERALVRKVAEAAGAAFAVSDHWLKGGEGALELAEAVIKACDEPNNFDFLCDLNEPLKDRIEKQVKEVYGGDGVDFEPLALEKLEKFQADDELKLLPICIAKTQYSLSHDPSLSGRPKGWRMPVKDVLIYKGAGLVVPVAGEIKLMPGTSASPAYRRIDVDVETGKVKGLF
jgi:formate--tetrahydrofolate ligase